MMAKITTGSSFGGALDYDRDKNQQNQKIATFLDSCGVDMNYRPDGAPDPDMKAVVRSFEIQAAMNPKVSKPVVHIALTFKPEDKPRLTNDYMVKLAKEYIISCTFPSFWIYIICIINIIKQSLAIEIYTIINKSLIIYIFVKCTRRIIFFFCGQSTFFTIKWSFTSIDNSLNLNLLCFIWRCIID